jgi:endonuclease G
MNNIDDYLLHEFNNLDDERRVEESLSEEAQLPMPRLPMLLRVKGYTRWRPKNIPDCSVIAQMGNIVACIGSRRTLEALRYDRRVISIEASRSVFTPECKHSLPFVKADKIHYPPLQEKGNQALIAIIDNGIDVLHHAFRDATGKRTRILAVWDQTDPTGPGPRIGQDQRTGTLYTQDQLNKFLANPHMLPPGLQRSRENSGHGTHVASIAAGRAIAQSGFSGGVAPEAKLLVVILDSQIKAGQQPGLGYSASLTAAFAFIDIFAQKQNLPVVVNLSQGDNAGAHDGTSSLEAIFDQFTNGGREPGRVIVKSAGNERNKRVHAKLPLKSGQRHILQWQSLPIEYSDDGISPDKATIEVWFQACDEVTFRLISPHNEYTPEVKATHPTSRGSFNNSRTRYELSYTRYAVDDGDSRLLITLTPPPGAPQLLSGEWRLQIDCKTIRSNREMHAWIERTKERNLRFTNHISEEITLSIPGTAQTVISVGSINATSAFSVSHFSAYGPTRDGRYKPEICAPGENITAAKNNTLTDLTTYSGTSMAAPHVTGAIALLFSYWDKKIQAQREKRLNAAQVRAAICQTTQNFNSHWNSDTGYGVLDIESLLHAFQ